VAVPDVSEEVVRRVIGSLGFPRDRVDQAVACLLDQAPSVTSVSCRVLSFRETCETLSLSKSGLRRIMAAGELVPLRLSERRIGFRVSDVTAFIESRTRPWRELD